MYYMTHDCELWCIFMVNPTLILHPCPDSWTEGYELMSGWPAGKALHIGCSLLRISFPADQKLVAQILIFLVFSGPISLSRSHTISPLKKQ